MNSAFALSIPNNYSFFKGVASHGRSEVQNALRKYGKSREAVLSVLVFSAVLSTGCGGSSDHAAESAAGNEYSQNSNAAVVAAGNGSIASSFTVNPTKDFEGFNHEEWNTQQSWMECNCGNNKPLEPQIMTWNPGA
jgi:hypothetical protein